MRQLINDMMQWLNNGLSLFFDNLGQLLSGILSSSNWNGITAIFTILAVIIACKPKENPTSQLAPAYPTSQLAPAYPTSQLAPAYPTSQLAPAYHNDYYVCGLCGISPHCLSVGGLSYIYGIYALRNAYRGAQS
jgi:hypothetical protein